MYKVFICPTERKYGRYSGLIRTIFFNGGTARGTITTEVSATLNGVFELMNVPESNVWRDMRELAQRLFHAKELLDDPVGLPLSPGKKIRSLNQHSYEQKLLRSPLLSNLTEAYTRTRGAILYLMCLIRYSSRSKDKIQMIFEFTAPYVELLLKCQSSLRRYFKCCLCHMRNHDMHPWHCNGGLS